MPDTSVILLFVKQPAAGQVKSRIGAVLGKDRALELYRNFVLDSLETVERTGIPFRVCIHPPDALPAASSWLGERRTYLPQTGTDLGMRMEQAFRAIFAEGVERAVLIGSDLPDLPVERLHEALRALETNDAVIGPARDGGYYLIGFRRDGLLPDIFRGITWGGPGVFERTMEVFRQAGTTVHVLPPWQDADTIQDLRDLIKRNEGTAFASSRTMRYLGTIKHRLADREEHYGEI